MVVAAVKMDETGVLVYVCALKFSKSSLKLNVTVDSDLICMFALLKAGVKTVAGDDAPTVDDFHQLQYRLRPGYNARY